MKEEFIEKWRQTVSEMTKNIVFLGLATVFHWAVLEFAPF